MSSESENDRKRKKTMKLAKKWWGYWCAIDSGQIYVGNSDYRALEKDHDELMAYGKEHGTLLDVLQELLEREEEYDETYSQVVALQRIVKEVSLELASE
jgi:hypothetical protein